MTHGECEDARVAVAQTGWSTDFKIYNNITKNTNNLNQRPDGCSYLIDGGTVKFSFVDPSYREYKIQYDGSSIAPDCGHAYGAVGAVGACLCKKLPDTTSTPSPAPAAIVVYSDITSGKCNQDLSVTDCETIFNQENGDGEFEVINESDRAQGCLVLDDSNEKYYQFNQAGTDCDKDSVGTNAQINLNITCLCQNGGGGGPTAAQLAAMDAEVAVEAAARDADDAQAAANDAQIAAQIAASSLNSDQDYLDLQGFAAAAANYAAQAAAAANAAQLVIDNNIVNSIVTTQTMISNAAVAAYNAAQAATYATAAQGYATAAAVPAKCDTIDLAFCAGTEHTGNLIAGASCGGALCDADDAVDCCGVIHPVARKYAADAAAEVVSAGMYAQHAQSADKAEHATNSAFKATRAASEAARYAVQAADAQTNAAKAAKADAKAQAEAADDSATAAAKTAAKATVYAAIYAASEAAGGDGVVGVTSVVTLALDDLGDTAKREILKTVYNNVDC